MKANVGLLMLALGLMSWLSSRSNAETPPVRVMSYNIRYGTAKDGKNVWENRKEFLVETIEQFAPDLLGTQETLGFQRDYLAAQLFGYEAVGVGRDDGGDSGEMTAVFYRTDRFEKLDGGHFWLSETPDVPGSVSWDSSLTRMATWVKLKDCRADSNRIVWFFNTHFDHRGEQARLESARLIRRQITDHTGDAPVVLTGDFNAAEASDPYNALFEVDGSKQRRLQDAYRVANPERQDAEGTFSGFDNTHPTGGRIDWIACSGNWDVEQAEIVRMSRDGRTPSDHLPVTAVLRYAD